MNNLYISLLNRLFRDLDNLSIYLEESETPECDQRTIIEALALVTRLKEEVKIKH